MQRVLQWLIYLWVRGIVALVGVLPAPLAYGCCRAVALLIYLVDRKHHRIGMINLGIAFPDKDLCWKKRILRRSLQQIGDQIVELSRIHRLTAEKLAQRVCYEQARGLENYLEAKEKGRGVLYLTAHVSVWELLPAAHALYGYPLSFVVRPLDNPFLDRWATALRSRFGNQVLPKRRSLRRVLKILSEGGEVGFLIDQNTQENEGVFVPFLGKLACTTSGLAALALKTSAPVVAGFIYPEGRAGHYTIRFYPPLKTVDTGNHEQDLIENTACYNSYVEQVVREFPHCWLWGHRRFRTQPNGTDPYRKKGTST